MTYDMIEMTRLLKTLIDNKLSIGQYFLLLLLYYRANVDKTLAQEWMEDYRNACGYVDGERKTVASSNDVQALLQDGWITKPGDKAGYVLTEKVNRLFLDPYELGHEFFENYPSFGIIQGNNIPLQVCDRVGVYFKYWQLIRGSVAEHKEIIKDLQFGVDNDLISMNIAKFVDSMYWIPIRRLRTLNKLVTTTAKSLDNDF